jgi:hypothetical protein
VSSTTTTGTVSVPTQTTSKRSDQLDRWPIGVASSGSRLTVLVAGERLTLNSEAGRALIEDMCRYIEGLLDDEGLCGTWHMSPGELVALKNNQEVFESVRAMRHRREQDGSAAREAGRMLRV